MKPQQWSAGDAIAASRLNSLTRESLRSRNGETLGPGNCEVGDNFGSSSANHSKPAMHLCFATEDFKADQYTDNYLALDKIASGKCVLVRFNPSTGDYEEETSFEPFRIWDPVAKLTESESKKEGDFFYAAYNKDNQRLEVFSFTKKNLQVILMEDLLAAVDTLTDPSIAKARVLARKLNGDLEITTREITLVNRFLNISIDSGIYGKAEWIDGEWQLYAADCPSQSASVMSIGFSSSGPIRPPLTESQLFEFPPPPPLPGGP